jgi:hypothetical protein
MLPGDVLMYFFNLVEQHELQFVIWDQGNYESAVRARTKELQQYFADVLEAVRNPLPGKENEHQIMRDELIRFTSRLATRNERYGYVIMA